MASLKTKFSVGLFVIIGFTFSVIAIIWIGMSHYFEKGIYYEAYFDESVQGLNVDSPVKYRGVSIGRVESISVAPDSTLIKTILKIESQMKQDMQVIAQLKSVGITGIMYVELDKKEDDEPDLSPKIIFNTEYPVIATKPSDIKQFIENVNDIFKQVNALDIAGLSKSLKSTVDEINIAVAALNTAELSSSILDSLKVWDNALASVDHTAASFNDLSISTGRTVTSLNRILENNEKELADAIAGLNKSTKNAENLLFTGTELIKNTDDNLYKLMMHLMVTLKNIERASENLNQTLEVIADQPSQLVFGQPVPPRKIE